MFAGIDLSLNSTGVCIYDSTTNQHLYYIILPHMTRGQRRAMDSSNGKLTYIEYDKTDSDDENIYNIKNQIKDILTTHNITHAYIESPALQAKGRSVITLSGLNYSVRQMLLENQITFLPIQPTALKSWFTGNGMADKDLMIYCWYQIEKFKPKAIKVDDMADAFALCEMCREKTYTISSHKHTFTAI